MPFGLCNAAQTFQRMMDVIMQGLQHTFVYLDDCLVASRNMEDHILHLGQVMTRLQTAGLRINFKKCVFAVGNLQFLGHSVSASGMSPVSDNVAAVRNFPPPSDIKQLQRFLGMINFYRRFMPQAARVLKPLTDALAGCPKTLTWTPDLQTAFVAAKVALEGAVPLAFPLPAARLSLAVDASESHVGGVLQQFGKHGWQPLAFFSKKLSVAQVKYSAFDRELLAMYLAVRQFRFMLEGRTFTIFTDHRPLVSAISRVTPPWSATQ